MHSIHYAKLLLLTRTVPLFTGRRSKRRLHKRFDLGWSLRENFLRDFSGCTCSVNRLSIIYIRSKTTGSHLLKLPTTRLSPLLPELSAHFLFRRGIIFQNDLESGLILESLPRLGVLINLDPSQSRSPSDTSDSPYPLRWYFPGSSSATLTEAATIAVYRLIAALGLELLHASQSTWADPCFPVLM